MFGLGISYKRIVDDIAREALASDPLAVPGFGELIDEGGIYNALKGVAAVLFLSQRAFLGVGEQAKFEKCRGRLGRSFIMALEKNYSSVEMRSLVLPLLEKRHIEYEALLDGQEPAGDRVGALGHVVLQNCLGGDVEESRAHVVTFFIVNKLMIEPAKKFKDLNDAGKVRG